MANPLKVSLLFAAVLLAVYGSTLWFSYGIRDDYAFLLNLFTDRKLHFPENIAAQGRPLYALFVWFFYRMGENIDGLSEVRAVGLLGLWALSLSIFITARRYDWSWISSITLALAMVLTPAAGVYVAWAATAQVPFACLAAWWAGYAVLSTRHRWVSVPLLLIAVTLYQTAVTCFWLPLLLWLFSPIAPRITRQTLKAPLLYFILSLIIYYIAYRLAVLWLWEGLYPQAIGRSQITFNLIAKATWFFTEVMPVLFSLPWLTAPLFYSIPLALFCIAGVGNYIWKQRSPWLAVIALAAVPTLFFPHLLVDSPYLSFRILGPLSMLVVLYLWVALSTLITAQILTVSLFALVTGWQVYHDIALLYHREQQTLQAQLPATLPVKAQLLRPALATSESEYGVPASALPANDFLENAFRERFGAVPAIGDCAEQEETLECVVIDMKKMPK